jgi:diguanylate cyclase (GGDEF)-like protein
VSDTQTVLLLIALQQGLCAFSWWVGGWRLGLPKRVSAHWIVAALATAAGLSLVLQRGRWPDVLTLEIANLAIMAGFIAMRRGVQLFLHITVTDREQALVLALDAVLLLGLVAQPELRAAAVIGASVPIAWTLLRAALESHRALRAEGTPATAHVVAAPLALLGLLFAMRAVAGVLAPDVAARPLHESNGFNAGIALAFMLVGLMLNLVLALMVVGRLVSRLQQLSDRDALTGLLNRRALTPLLQREAGRLRRYGESYALLMIDIDHFKAINDGHGHAAGDRALVQLATVLRQAAREVDHVARLGGEEFCLLLPHSDLDGATHLAQRVHEAVRRAAWGEFERGITVSVGVAVAQSADEAPQAVLERADQALYGAKNAGRDRVMLADPPGLARTSGLAPGLPSS